MRLIPWGLGLRNAQRMRGYSILVAVTVASLVSLAFALATIRSTATVTASELAGYAMGDADILVRVEPGHEPPPQSTLGELGITGILPLQPLTTIITADDRSREVEGRIVDYGDPLVAPMTVSVETTGAHQIALSPKLAESLGIQLGDTVQLPAGDRPINLTVTDLVAVADLDYPLFFITPDALPEADLASVLASASDLSREQWLVTAPDPVQAIEYFSDQGFQVSTPDGYTNQEPRTLVNLDIILVLASLAAAGVLAGGLAGLSRQRRVQGLTLSAAGTAYRSIRGIWVVQTGMVAIPAALLGLGLGWLGALGAVPLLSRAARQYWGELEPAWTIGIGAAAAACLISVYVASATSPRPASAPAKPVRVPRISRKHRTSMIPGLLAMRLRHRNSRSTMLGLSAIAVTSALGSAVTIIMTAAIGNISHSYEPDIPVGTGALSIPRPLSINELHRFEATANVAALEDRRASYGTSESHERIVLLQNDYFNCILQNTPEKCAEKFEGLYPRSVAIIPDLTAVEHYFGRDLSHEERKSFTSGDGLLLADPGSLSNPGSVHLVSPHDTSEKYSQEVFPVVVTSYEPYQRAPGLLISSLSAERLGLHPEKVPISWYLMRPITGEQLDPVVIRDALPADLAAVAEVSVENGPPVGTYRSVTRMVVMALSCIAFLVTLLLSATWANDCYQQFRTLGYLGVGPWRLRQILVVRTFQSLTISVVGALGLSSLGAWLFLTSVGSQFSLNDPQWLYPIAAIVVSGLVTSIAFAPVGDTRSR